ncbi:lysylphosphatidylglycerol synthase domain-containing protein [Dactylosporangium matsuzakiense]|uniref:lysylphosphatidylglycerol synthase domain-containing protein n=1 Tax=Dactylosporangium matsuzakiense TaxID=53360 RepID=UPI0034D97E8C
MGTAALVYLIASSLSGAVPSPGGTGALEITLLGGLTAVGVSPATAVTAVVGDRLVTVWVPLLPSVFVPAKLQYRRML